MYILGNAHNLASKSKMWRSVIEELEKDDAVGDGLPVSCHQHPEHVQLISQPGQLPLFAPDGQFLPEARKRPRSNLYLARGMFEGVRCSSPMWPLMPIQSRPTS